MFNRILNDTFFVHLVTLGFLVQS